MSYATTEAQALAAETLANLTPLGSLSVDETRGDILTTGFHVSRIGSIVAVQTIEGAGAIDHGTEKAARVALDQVSLAPEFAPPEPPARAAEA